MILLDTHVLLWVTQEPNKIGNVARTIISENWNNRTVAVSAISFWECQMLQNKGRIHLSASVALWRDKLLNAGLIELVVDGEIGVTASNLDTHGDPADRLIMATAIKHDMTLATADLKILQYSAELNRLNIKK